MRKASFYVALYWIIKNNSGEILFMKRENTGFRDWEYQVPAWHLEWEEEVKIWMLRELKEELAIDVKEEDLEIIHVSHSNCSDKKVYIDFYLEVKKYSGEIKNNEAEKCSELKFININKIKKEDKEKYFWFDLEVLEKINTWKNFSEVYIDLK